MKGIDNLGVVIFLSKVNEKPSGKTKLFIFLLEYVSDLSQWFDKSPKIEIISGRALFKLVSFLKVLSNCLSSNISVFFEEIVAAISSWIFSNLSWVNLSIKTSILLVLEV